MSKCTHMPVRLPRSKISSSRAAQATPALSPRRRGRGTAVLTVTLQVARTDAERAAVAIAAMQGGYRHLEKAAEVRALLSIGRAVVRASRAARLRAAAREALCCEDAL